MRRLRPIESAVLRHDAYYHDLSHLSREQRDEVNVDHPDSLETPLLVDHVTALRSGIAIEMPVYDFVSQTRAPSGVVIQPASVIFVEGMLSFHDERLRGLMDLRVFMDATEADRLERRTARDVRERGRDARTVREQHVSRVQPMHERFAAPARHHADMLISGGAQNRQAIEQVAARIEVLLLA